MIAHFKNPGQLVPGSNMPPIHLTDAKLNALSAFLLKLTPENAQALAEAPSFAVRGSEIYVANGCGDCHSVNGVGMAVGPPLNGVSMRHPKDWIEQHFRDPQALSPGSIMPSYKFSPREMDAIVSYLLSLPETANQSNTPDRRQPP